MSLHNEIEFENDLCTYLDAHGWLYSKDDAKDYDRARARIKLVASRVKPSKA